MSFLFIYLVMPLFNVMYVQLPCFLSLNYSFASFFLYLYYQSFISIFLIPFILVLSFVPLSLYLLFVCLSLLFLCIVIFGSFISLPIIPLWSLTPLPPVLLLYLSMNLLCQIIIPLSGFFYSFKIFCDLICSFIFLPINPFISISYSFISVCLTSLS